MKNYILIIDDDTTVLESLEIEISSLVNTNKYFIETCTFGDEAIDLANEILNNDGKIALIICDYLMPGIRGDSVLTILHKISPESIKILLTGHIELEAVTNAINNAALYRYIPKPWEKNDFDLAIVEAIKTYETKREIESQRNILREQNNKLQSLYQRNEVHRQHLELALDNANMFWWEYDNKIRKFSIDGRIKDYLKLDIEQSSLSESIIDFIFPEDRAMLLEKINSLTGTNYLLNEDLRVQHPNGDILWFTTKGKYTAKQENNKEVFTGICFDITETKIEHQAIIENEKKLRSIYENNTLSVIKGKVIFIDGKITDLLIQEHNIATESLFEFSSAETKPKFLSDIFDVIDDNLINFFSNLLSTEKYSVIEGYYKTMNKFFHVIGNRFNHSTDEVIIITLDMTNHYRYEEEIKIAKQIAEENNQMKTAFLANMSHEIRTPLNQIMGFSQLLVRDDLDNEERKDYSNILLRNSQKLLRMINDVIDISRIEANQFSVYVNEISVNNVLHDIYTKTMAELQIADKLHINFSITKQLSDDDAIIITDESRLIQILTNLLDNAVKFTAQGFIECGYEYNFEKYSIDFFVRDTGIGISEENMNRIFEQFWQADSSFTRMYEGTGLGLALCKCLVKVLEGSIRVESKLGFGSTFFVTIPINHSTYNE